jgi:hypothetical protein
MELDDRFVPIIKINVVAMCVYDCSTLPLLISLLPSFNTTCRIRTTLFALFFCPSITKSSIAGQSYVGSLSLRRHIESTNTLAHQRQEVPRDLIFEYGLLKVAKASSYRCMCTISIIFSTDGEIPCRSCPLFLCSAKESWESEFSRFFSLSRKSAGTSECFYSSCFLV